MKRILERLDLLHLKTYSEYTFYGTGASIQVSQHLSKNPEVTVDGVIINMSTAKNCLSVTGLVNGIHTVRIRG